MEGMGGMFGMLGGIAGGAMQAQAQNTATMIQYMNLLFQKQQAAKQYRLSTAGRTDAYGNKQRYNEGTNEWEMNLTPLQNQIIKAGESEQLKSVTEDATRNRDIKRNQYQRGVNAREDYNTALAGLRFDQPPETNATEGKLQSLMLGAKQDARKGTQADMIRNAIRIGRGGDVARIIKATDDDLGAGTNDVLLQARQQALQESAARQQQHTQKYMPELARTAGLMDQGGDAALRFSDTPDKLMAVQGQQMQGIMQAMQNEAQNVGGAYNAFAGAAGKPAFSIKDVASLVSSFGKGSSGGGGGGSSGRRKSGGNGFYDEGSQMPDFTGGWDYTNGMPGFNMNDWSMYDRTSDDDFFG